MDTLASRFFNTFLDLYLDTAIWLLAGLALAAVLKGAMPTRLVQRWLGGNGAGSVVRGALIGAPLPLCSCGVLPAAIGLHRAGASRPSTVSFLIATPETGVDSIAVSYALLGPVMAVIRPLAAILSAIATGLLVLAAAQGRTPTTQPEQAPHAANACSSRSATSCCSASKTSASDGCSPPPASTGCCGSGDSCDAAQSGTNGRLLRFYAALIDLLDDIKVWLLFGLVLAALFGTFVEPAALSDYGNSIWAMLILLLVSLPLYICATASTPIAAVMLGAGISPGAVLVFMLVGPATNIASIGLLIREFGVRTVMLYLGGIAVTAILIGLGVNQLFSVDTLSLPTAGPGSHETLWLQGSAAAVLTLLAIGPVRRLLVREAADGCAKD
jgi:uncharacterized membrane protein YraQ (UPF0718 family)